MGRCVILQIRMVCWHAWSGSAHSDSTPPVLEGSKECTANAVAFTAYKHTIDWDPKKQHILLQLVHSKGDQCYSVCVCLCMSVCMCVCVLIIYHPLWLREDAQWIYIDLLAFLEADCRKSSMFACSPVCEYTGLRDWGHMVRRPANGTSAGPDIHRLSWWWAIHQCQLHAGSSTLSIASAADLYGLTHQWHSIHCES